MTTKKSASSKLVINNKMCKYPILPKVAQESNAFETILKLDSEGKLEAPPESKAGQEYRGARMNNQKATISASQSEEWDIFWIDTGVSMERVLDLNDMQKINHFPGMHEICRKDQLARKSKELSKSHPDEYNFFPKSWIFPADWIDFKQSFYSKAKRAHCFISKPDHGCQGKGIFLFKDPKSLENFDRDGMVVQSYIRNPCLLNGFKFDLRVYVLVTSVAPLRIFVYKDGLARFATEPYEKPAKKNLKNMCMHLTNYAINKNSTQYIIDEDSATGSKRTIQSVFKELENQSNSRTTAEDLWDQVYDVIVKTLLLVQPGLAKNCKPWFPSQISALPLKGSQCFEILGFDILLDSQLKPWVLEVNHSPSFTCDSTLDECIKSRVLLDAIKLLHVSKKSLKKHMTDQKIKSMQRLFSECKLGENSLPIKSNQTRIASEITLVAAEEDRSILPGHAAALEQYHKLYSKQVLDKLTAWEDRHTGNYKRLFPPQSERALAKYLYLLQETEKRPAATLAIKLRKEFLEKKKQDGTGQKLKMDARKKKILAMSSFPKTNVEVKEMRTARSTQERILPKIAGKKQQLLPIKVQSLSLQVFPNRK